MKRYWTGIALAMGPAIVIAAVVWEIARMNPEYGFLVTPWSIVGYETIHGWVFVTLGLALLAGGMLVLWEASTSGRGRLGVLAYFVVAGSVIALAFAPSTTTISLGPVLSVFVALFVALIVQRFTAGALARVVSFMDRGWARALYLLILWVIIAIVFFVALVDKEVTVNSTLAVVVGLTLLAVYASAAQPRGLAGNRMLIYCTMIAGTVIVCSAGAIRSTLLRLQFEETGVSAEYRDTQVSLAWFLAVFGMVILFVGAVGLWAKRQDLLEALTRVRRQRDAAEKSAAEIKAAEEAYLAEVGHTP